MGSRPTIKEIANNLGVSLGTVHRAIYGKPGVGEEMREKVLAEVKRLNYQIDEAASSLKRKELHIAVVLPKPVGEERFFFSGIWQGIRKEAAELEKFKIIFHYIETEFSMNKLDHALMQVFDSSIDEIDGLITMADEKASNEWIPRFYRQGVTIVLIASSWESPAVFCNIRADHANEGVLAAHYMAETLHQNKGKILAFTGNREAFSNVVYGDSFIREISEKTAPENVIRIEGMGREAIREKSTEIIRNENVIGIFCCNARNTIEICRILEKEKKQGIIFLGTDVFPELKPYFDNGILSASVYQSNYEQGSKAVYVLYQYLTYGKRESKQSELPFNLVMKENFKYFVH